MICHMSYVISYDWVIPTWAGDIVVILLKVDIDVEIDDNKNSGYEYDYDPGNSLLTTV